MEINPLAYTTNVLQVGLVIILAFIAYKIGTAIINRVFQSNKRQVLNEEITDLLIFGTRTILKYGLIFLVLLITLEIFQVDVIGPDELRNIGVVALKTLGIIILAKISLNIGTQVIEHIFLKKVKKKEDILNERRKKTLSSLLKSLITYVIYFIAAIMILENFGIKTSSILAGVGVLGLAVSFGAQSLIKDIINGFFIMFEDQYNVGEWVIASGVFGSVEELGLRTTKIKEWTGELHIIPNGEITQITNYSRDNMLALVTIRIAYEENIEDAIKILTEEGNKAFQELDSIVEAPNVQGVTELGDSDVNIRTIIKTLPGEQWAVEREMRKRFKMALDKAGIEIPYPRRVVIT